jgi:prepilin-type processing-associated H-X9-DG protein
LVTSAVPFFHCPSRRSALLYPHYARYANDFPNVDWPKESSKTDYAANGGDETALMNKFKKSPASLAHGDTTFKWSDLTPVTRSTGICYARSEIRIRDISDGTTNTILVGEKFLRVNNYDKGEKAGDDQCLYAGHNSDTLRASDPEPVQDYLDPLNSEIGDRWYGSAHTGGCNVAMCDGSVHVVNYNIDREVFRGMGNRMDGKPTTDPFQ